MHVPAEQELVVENADLVLELLAPACAKRSRADGGFKDSSLQKPVPDGELKELCLTCALPRKHLSKAARAGPAPAFSLVCPAAALPRQTSCCWAGEFVKSSLIRKRQPMSLCRCHCDPAMG